MSWFQGECPVAVSRMVVLANYYTFIRALEARLQRPIAPQGAPLDEVLASCRRLRAVHARLDGQPGCADLGVHRGLDEACTLGDLAQRVERYQDFAWNAAKFDARLVEAYAALAYVDGPQTLELSA